MRFECDFLCDVVCGVCDCVWLCCLICLCVLPGYCDVVRFVMCLRALLCVCVCVCLCVLCVCSLFETYRMMLYCVFISGVLLLCVFRL